MSLGYNNPLIIAAVLAALFAAIYAPALGHGFVTDDFRWIEAADVHAPDDMRRIFAGNVGFYRPLVTTSFAVDRALWQLDPRGYALTNAVLLSADACLIFLLARRLSLPVPAALFAAGVWAFNFHGINMALLWTSGRTALLMLVFALAATLALLRGNRVAAGLLSLCAMLCKEEAVVLPPLLTIVDLWRDGAGGRRIAVLRSWPLWLAAAGYALLRHSSGAFGFADAPAYYQLTFVPRSLLRNAAEYLDRGATAAIVSIIVVWIAVPHARAFTNQERWIIRFGVLWFAAMYAFTMFVQARSSLYAVAPSIGSALVAGAFAARAQRIASRRFAGASAALLVIVAVLVPVYRIRNHGLVEPADLSSQALKTLRQGQLTTPDVREVVLLDDERAPVTLDSAFGSLLPQAVHLFLGPDVRATLRNAVSTDEAPDSGALVFRLSDGRLIRQSPDRPTP